MASFTRYLFPALITTAVLVCGFFWLREEVTTSIYRQKLEAVAEEYAALRDQYNQVVRESAITELEATEDSLSILIRTGDGQIRRIPTPFDPAREIYVDYLVGNGRIWIRRIFDQATPPEKAMVIDPLWDQIEWRTSGPQYGKAIYRSLEPGIWAISVSGNGALDLKRVAESRQELLQASPRVRSYEEIRLSLDREVESIGFADIWAYCTGWMKK
ncbi:MAG: hypothetical protein ACP5I4_07060 [Oceanipulchritudo sp.]